MAQQNINIGSSANKGDGDPIRVAFTKVNANFTDLFARVIVLEGGGVAVAQDIQGDIYAQDSSLAYNSATNTHYGSFIGALAGDVTGSVFADNSTVIIDGVAGTVSSSALSGNLPALDGSALTNLTIPAQTFASLTGTPTTIVGYGISDAYTKAEVDSSIASVTAGHFDFNITGDDSTVRTVTSGSTLQITGGTAITTASDVDGNITINGVAQDFAFASLTGTPTTIAGYGITDALALGTSSTTALAGDTALFDGAFASLTSKPTTIAGYGITDALELGTSSTTALAGDTALFDGVFASLTSKPTTIAGYGITDALVTGNSAGTAAPYNLSLDNIADANGNALSTTHELYFNPTPSEPIQFFSSNNTFTGPENVGLVFARGDGQDFSTIALGAIDDDNGRMLFSNRVGGSLNEQVVIDIQGATVDFPSTTTVDFTGATVTGLSVSGLQSRSLRTNQTSSLADGAEADLDITGFKAYALMAITTDRAARVRLYVKAASRTADASRAEGVDPTSDAGLIAEVITTGADTVIISPGAYGFNLESSTTTNIPCRVTNKSGSTSTVQVTLVVLQLEA